MLIAIFLCVSKILKLFRYEISHIAVSSWYIHYIHKSSQNTRDLMGEHWSMLARRLGAILGTVSAATSLFALRIVI